MPKTDQRIQRTVAWIQNNYAANVRLEDLAAVACLSKYHFSRVFSRVIGLSPFEYLAQFT